jgi:hypothetical protein
MAASIPQCSVPRGNSYWETVINAEGTASPRALTAETAPEEMSESPEPTITTVDSVADAANDDVSMLDAADSAQDIVVRQC